MKAFKYLVIYMLIIQLALPYAIPLDTGYRYRMNYNLVKDNLNDIDVILDQIQHQIQKEHLKEYLVILGDSVAFSGPGPSKTSLGCCLEELSRRSDPNHPLLVFNLAMPAMQTGDIYTMLLKLDRHNISTDHVIMDVAYSGFVLRQPTPPAVFWLKDELHDLDIDSFNRVRLNLNANHYQPQEGPAFLIQRTMAKNVALLAYRDFIKKDCRDLLSKNPSDDSLGDDGPWYDKKGLTDLLKQPEYQHEFLPEPFDMSPRNPQIYFLDKIIRHQAGKHTLIFLAAVNEQLLGEKATSPAYTGNLSRIDRYFAHQKEIKYLNLQGKLDQSLFCDWIHLTPAGYKQLAYILWENFNTGVNY